MTVYVDKLHDWGWKLGPSCHLLPANQGAAALEELHAFAAKLGMKRQWFQNKRWPHYDLVASRRARAVQLGAVEIDVTAWMRLQKDPLA